MARKITDNDIYSDEFLKKLSDKCKSASNASQKLRDFQLKYGSIVNTASKN